MLNDKERDRIADKLADDPRRALVEQAAAERENALRLGQTDAVERTGRVLSGLGYEPEDARADAAKARKAAAEKKSAEKRDDDGGDEGKDARHQPPAERHAPADRKQTADKPATGKQRT